MKKTFFSLILILSLCACAKTDYSQIKVIKVIDGDTVKLSNGKLLRYIGIDTPEIRIRKNGEFVYSPQPFALEAKAYNEKLTENRFVRIEFDVQKKDKYGRLLGYCFADGVFVNAKLIEDGYAVLYTFPPNTAHTDFFAKLQKEARKNKRGLWGSYEVIAHHQAADHINQIRTIRGEVVDTYQSQKCVYLNFGKNYKKDFTVVIFNNSLNEFIDKNIDPATFYKNKLIEVTGKVKEYNGPEVIINHPNEITVINEE